MEKQIRWTPVQCAKVFSAYLDEVFTAWHGKIQADYAVEAGLLGIQKLAEKFHILIVYETIPDSENEDFVIYTGYKIGRLLD